MVSASPKSIRYSPQNDGSKLLAKGAMELKFKKKTQGAEDFARIDSYEDIECLEHCLDRNYETAYFCMIADNNIYSRESKLGTTGDIFFNAKWIYTTR
ncbi:hypothetical protein [Paenibacillus durus]|uniref:Uncharacterized protein n=1 Tax=Paenibacillus durus ATCC 35681 TaxID=1333534 RepID=A0A0F7CI32_PAEDU|nr:hypothetical protein [Paenibacillus durus]AKG34991.1 hypothetical protein VK70_10795 [Paenibacillus durus ATCC 35681]